VVQNRLLRRGDERGRRYLLQALLPDDIERSPQDLVRFHGEGGAVDEAALVTVRDSVPLDFEREARRKRVGEGEGVLEGEGWSGRCGGACPHQVVQQAQEAVVHHFQLERSSR